MKKAIYCCVQECQMLLKWTCHDVWLNKRAIDGSNEAGYANTLGALRTCDSFMSVRLYCGSLSNLLINMLFVFNAFSISNIQLLYTLTI